jgi:hypothetical protein
MAHMNNVSLEAAIVCTCSDPSKMHEGGVPIQNMGGNTYTAYLNAAGDAANMGYVVRVSWPTVLATEFQRTARAMGHSHLVLDTMRVVATDGRGVPLQNSHIQIRPNKVPVEFSANWKGDRLSIATIPKNMPPECSAMSKLGGSIPLKITFIALFKPSPQSQTADDGLCPDDGDDDGGVYRSLCPDDGDDDGGVLLRGAPPQEVHQSYTFFDSTQWVAPQTTIYHEPGKRIPGLEVTISLAVKTRCSGPEAAASNRAAEKKAAQLKQAQAQQAEVNRLILDCEQKYGEHLEEKRKAKIALDNAEFCASMMLDTLSGLKAKRQRLLGGLTPE